MRKTKPMTFGEIWSDFLRDNPAAARRSAEARIPEAWAKLVGAKVTSLTENINVVKGVMYVRITSSVARNEIFMRREELKDAINTELGTQVVNVIIVK